MYTCCHLANSVGATNGAALVNMLRNYKQSKSNDITCLVSAILVAMTILCMPGGGRSNTLSWFTVGISECSGIIRNLSATQYQHTVLLAQSTIFVIQVTIIDHPRSCVVYNFGHVCMYVCMSARR